MKKRVFISYAKEDKLFAEKLHADLCKAGLRPWLDSKDLIPGQRWAKVIESAIEDSAYFLAILSKNSVRKTGYSQKELRQALGIAERKPEDVAFIIPVRVDECDPSFEGLRDLHRADFFPTYEPGLQELLRALNYEPVEKLALVVDDAHRVAGTIKKLSDKGFGFVTVKTIMKDLFFHMSELRGILWDELREGDSVTLAVAKSPRGLVATQVERA